MIKLDNHWTLFKHADLFYARTNCYGHDKNGKYKLLETWLLHRWVMNCKKHDGSNIDHINHNGLDNRKANLRDIKVYQNSTNRKAKNKNNKSGYRNVFWNTAAQAWHVTLCKNNRRINLGMFDDVHKAGQIAKKAREKYYGEYSGNH